MGGEDGRKRAQLVSGGHIVVCGCDMVRCRRAGGYVCHGESMEERSGLGLLKKYFNAFLPEKEMRRHARQHCLWLDHISISSLVRSSNDHRPSKAARHGQSQYRVIAAIHSIPLKDDTAAPR